jgi:hypothetical protein
MPRPAKRHQAVAAAGISNRSLVEEIGRQNMVPSKGRRKARRGTERLFEPEPTRRRGRRGRPIEGPSSTRVDATAAARAATAGYGVFSRPGSPDDPAFTKATAAPNAQAPARRLNRRRTSRSR